MKAVTFIRLDSKRVPRKSVSPLAGRPLFDYALSTMNDVKGLDEILVFSSEDFIKDSISPGVDYTFVQREKYLDGDVTFNVVMNEAIKHIDSEFVLYFCVTSPFMKSETVDDIIDNVESGKYDSGLAVKASQSFCWYDGAPLNYDPTKTIPFTQDLSPVLVETSGLYVFKKELFENFGRRIGDNPYLKQVDEIEGHDIDYPIDFTLAEYYLENELV